MFRGALGRGGFGIEVDLLEVTDQLVDSSMCFLPIIMGRSTVTRPKKRRYARFCFYWLPVQNC